MPDAKAYSVAFAARAAAALAMLCALFLAAPVKAAAPPAAHVNYEDDALPIFRNNCLGCHNPDKKRAGLDLSSYESVMAGSGDGPVIKPGSPDDSTLYRVVMHLDDPNMPPNKEKLPDKELQALKAWIAQGALATANGKPAVAQKSDPQLAPIAVALGRPKGPPPMPVGLSLEPIVHTDRPGPLNALAASPWAPLIALGGQKQILLYNTQSLDLLGVLPFDDGEPYVLKFSRNGDWLMAGGGQGAKSGQVELFDVVKGKKLADVGDEFDSVLAADISPDQSMVALGGPAKVLKVYTVADNKLLYTRKKHTDWVTAVAFSPDGVLLASGDRGGNLVVWEAKSGNEFYTLTGHKAGITSLCFRDDSNVLASASDDGSIILWDMNSGRSIRNWKAHPDGVLSINFTHDGRLVSCGRDHLTKIWSAEGNPVRTLEALPDIALKTAFDESGTRVISGDWTGAIRVWNAADGKLVGDLSADPPPLAQQLQTARQRLAALAPTAADAQAKLAAAQKHADAAAAGLKTFEQESAALPGRIAAAQHQADSAKAAIASVHGALVSLQGRVSAGEGAVRQAQNAASQAADKLKKSPQDKSLADAAAKAQASVAAQQADLQALRKSADAHSAALTKSTDDQRAANAEISQLKKQQQQETARRHSLTEQNTQAAAALAAATAASQSASQSLAEAQSARDRLAAAVAAPHPSTQPSH